MMYRKLQGRIKEVYGTQKNFIKAMGMSYTALSFRLNGKAEWKASEIAKACELLHIPLTEAYLYFFNQKV